MAKLRSILLKNFNETDRATNLFQLLLPKQPILSNYLLAHARIYSINTSSEPGTHIRPWIQFKRKETFTNYWILP